MDQSITRDDDLFVEADTACPHDGSVSVIGYENGEGRCVIIGIADAEDEDALCLVVSPDYAELVAHALLREARAARAGERKACLEAAPH